MVRNKKGCLLRHRFSKKKGCPFLYVVSKLKYFLHNGKAPAFSFFLEVDDNFDNSTFSGVP